MEDGEKTELWDVYTKDRVRTGRYHVRGRKMPEGDYHLVVHVCIFNSRNEMLIQRRQPFKHGWPNLWDLTVGGSALAGDSSSQAAERELFEELGLRMDLSGVRPHFSVTFSDGFDDYYLIRQDVDLSALTLQKEEVQAVKWAGKEEVLRMQEEGTFIPYWFLDKLFEMQGWYDAFRNPETAVSVRYADERQLASWMSMVEIVRDHFPGLETEEKLNDYRDTVRRCMEKQTAVCAVMGNIVVGVLLFSVKHNMLACMAVHPEFRRRHIASKMLELMLAKMDRERPVVVETFREGDARGIEARAFYKRMGFEEGELCLFEGSYPEQKLYLRKWEEKNV